MSVQYYFEMEKYVYLRNSIVFSFALFGWGKNLFFTLTSFVGLRDARRLLFCFWEKNMFFWAILLYCLLFRKFDHSSVILFSLMVWKCLRPFGSYVYLSRNWTTIPLEFFVCVVKLSSFRSGKKEEKGRRNYPSRGEGVYYTLKNIGKFSVRLSFFDIKY